MKKYKKVEECQKALEYMYDKVKELSRWEVDKDEFIENYGLLQDFIDERGYSDE